MLIRQNEIIPKSGSRYYQKTKRLDLSILIPYELFSKLDKKGKYLLVVNKMLSAINNTDSKNLVRKQVYSLLQMFKKRLNPNFDPEWELNAMTKLLVKECKNSIRLYIKGSLKDGTGKTHVGGVPDVPEDFEWPFYNTEIFNPVDKYSHERKDLPLYFIAQFNCKDLAKYDKEGLLPKEGMLSFFYDLNEMKWGIEPEDKGFIRVYWFENTEKLHPATLPEGLDEDYIIPMMRVRMREEVSYPAYEDVDVCSLPLYDDDLYEKALKNLKVKEKDDISKLLGWPEDWQGSMFEEVEDVTNGNSDENEDSDLPFEQQQKRAQEARGKWQLLFQLDSLDSEEDNFDIMFGDAGSIYFFIPKDDLSKRRFDRVWMILQCM